MANVNIKFNNKDYLLSCDDGQEESLKKLTKFLAKLSLQDWKDAILWFLENEFWAPKLHSLKLVERHIQQFLASRKRVQPTRKVDVIK